MNRRYPIALVALFVAGLVSGCQVQLMSDEDAKAIGARVSRGFESVIEQAAIDRDARVAAEAFYRKREKWPASYLELKDFVAGSEGYLHLDSFDDITFKKLPDGSVEMATSRDGCKMSGVLKKPNKAPEPTSPSVTSRASARAAPAGAVAHL